MFVHKLLHKKYHTCKHADLSSKTMLWVYESTLIYLNNFFIKHSYTLRIFTALYMLIESQSVLKILK